MAVMDEFEKTCLACELPKPVSEFPRNKRKQDGYDIYCKLCTRARQKAAYARDPAKKIAKTRKYHLDHPEWSKRVQAEWHQANAERRLERHYELGQDPERAKKRRASTRRSESRRRAIRAGSDADVITEDEYASILEEYHGCCWICDADLTTEPMHWDHFQPLARAGKHVRSNMRPACSMCNVRKNAIWPITDSVLDRIRCAVLACRAGVPGG